MQLIGLEAIVPKSRLLTWFVTIHRVLVTFGIVMTETYFVAQSIAPITSQKVVAPSKTEAK